MTLPLRKRTVHFYEIKIESRTKADINNPSIAPLSDLLSSFAKLASSQRLPATIRKSPNIHTVLGDWKYDAAHNCYGLLISKANAAVSDIALRDLTTRRLRKAGKTKIEGIEDSAHLLIRPNKDGRTAAVLLTMGAGVSVRDLEVLLRMLGKEASTIPINRPLFYFDDPSGAKDTNNNPKQYKVGYLFSATAHQGQTLTQALSGGEFQALELIAHEDSKFDTGGNLQITERSLAVRAVLPKTVTGAAVRNAVNAYLRNPANTIQYDKVRIRYKTPSGKDTSATLEIQQLDAAFTLKELIEFDTDVESQQEKLSPIILDAMKPLLQLIPI